VLKLDPGFPPHVRLRGAATYDTSSFSGVRASDELILRTDDSAVRLRAAPVISTTRRSAVGSWAAMMLQKIAGPSRHVTPRIHRLRQSGQACETISFAICSRLVSSRIGPSKRAIMADQIVITEKSSQAKDVRAAVGSRYGDILPAEGHLFDLCEPEDVVPAWKRWSPILLRPEGLYGTRPAEGGNESAKLRAIREALRSAKRVWLATDCDREGQLIGQEILEHYEYRGQVMRVLFTAQDTQTIRDAFGRAKPNSEYARLYAAAVARRQADQIYNLSLTRTATVILGHGARRVIGVGRVKTPTLAIVCKRELEIRNFVPLAHFEVVATAKVAGG
jgi:DNA topoisomerase-3